LQYRSDPRRTGGSIPAERTTPREPRDTLSEGAANAILLGQNMISFASLIRRAGRLAGFPGPLAWRQCVRRRLFEISNAVN